MRDWFRDNMKPMKESNILGGYDPEMDSMFYLYRHQLLSGVKKVLNVKIMNGVSM